MPITKKIKSLEDKVKILITNNPKLRDDDKELFTVLWDIELRKKGLNPNIITSTEFFSMYSSGQLSSGELIARARRQVQTDNEELRGEKWHKRHKLADITRKTI